MALRLGAFGRWAAGALALLGAGGWLVSQSLRVDAGESARVERGDIVLSVDVSGTLRALESDVLKPPAVRRLWEFKIARLAPEGAVVTKGTPVVVFDSSDLERQILERRAEYDSAQKEIEKKEADLESRRGQDQLRLAEAEGKEKKAALKIERPSDVVAARELEKFQKDLEIAQKEVAYLKKRLAALEEVGRAELTLLREQRDRAAGRVKELGDAIRRMTVVAPRDGTVIYAAGRRGDKKKVGDSAWMDESVIEIPDLARMAAQGEVDEVDAGRVAVGQTVSLRLDAYPEIEFAGRVASMANTVQRQSSRTPLKVLRINIVLGETDPQRMRPGMRFRGTIEIGRGKNVLFLPREAIFPGPEGPVAYRRGLMGPEQRELSLGRRDARRVEVLEGLSEGDRVLLFEPGSERRE